MSLRFNKPKVSWTFRATWAEIQICFFPEYLTSWFQSTAQGCSNMFQSLQSLYCSPLLSGILGESLVRCNFRIHQLQISFKNLPHQCKQCTTVHNRLIPTSAFGKRAAWPHRSTFAVAAFQQLHRLVDASCPQELIRSHLLCCRSAEEDAKTLAIASNS